MESQTAVKAKHERIVRLIVAIKVNRCNCIVFICFYGSSMMIIAHKHHSIIINGGIRNTLRKKCCTRDSVAHGGVNGLAIIVTNTSYKIIFLAVFIMLTSADGSDISGSSHGIIFISSFSGLISSSTILIGHIPVCVGQINRLTPIRLDGDGSHSFGNIPVGTLVENAATFGVKVFILTFAVGKVVGCCCQFAFVIVGNIISGRVTSRRAACDTNNLPAGDYTIPRIITITIIVIIGQLNLTIIEIKMVIIFISNGQFNCTIEVRLKAST